MGLVRELLHLCEGFRPPASQAPPGAAAEAGASALAQLLQESARRLIAEAIDLELRHFKESRSQPGAPRQRDAIVRNGFHPVRMIATGIGAVPVRPRKVRHNGSGTAFRSALVPRYARRAQPLNGESAALYLCAIAGADVRHALGALIGPHAVALPHAVARGLQGWWHEQCKTWRANLPPELGTAEEFWPAFARAHSRLACERRYTRTIEGIPPGNRPAAAVDRAE